MQDYQSLAAKGKDAYLEALSGIGWFEFPQNNKEEIASHLSRLEDDGTYFVLSLSHLSFDSEGFDSADKYKDVLYKMAKLAGVALVSVEMEYDNSEEFGDTLSGKITTADSSYELELEGLIGWFDPDFVSFINNDILSGENSDIRIFELPAADQCTQYVFVSPDLYEKAIENGIIPEGEDYFMGDFME
jgi:hypothetical protein